MNSVVVWKVNAAPASYELEEIRFEDAADTLDAVSRLLPDGAYTTFRTYGGRRVVRFSEHLARLEAAARMTQHNNLTLDTGVIRSALHEAIDCSPASEHRIRLTLDLQAEPGAVYISMERMTPLPVSAYELGVKAVTVAIQRSMPEAKLTHFIASASDVRASLPPDVHEALMTSDGKVLEGLSSNFFAALDGVIWTAEEGVLSGVTRSIVIDEVRREGIPMHLWALPVERIAALQEAFITSSSRGVLPVVQIDAHVIGDGAPGPITRRLHQRYLQRIEAELEFI